MAIAPSTGAKIYIGPVTAAASVSAYAALTWVEIGSVESIGEFGDKPSMITFASLSDGRVRKRKGIMDAGDLNVTVAHDPLDLGQLAVITAAAGEFRYAFKVLLADGADANDTDSVFYFHALVMGFPITPGSANEIVKKQIQLAIDTAIYSTLSTAVP